MTGAYLDGLYKVTIQSAGASMGTATVLNFSASFTATPSPTTGAIDIAIAGTTADGLIRQSGDDVSVGPIDGTPGAFQILDDGGNVAVSVDNGLAIVTSAYAIQVTGGVRLAASVDWPTTTAPSPASGHAAGWYDGTTFQLRSSAGVAMLAASATATTFPGSVTVTKYLELPPMTAPSAPASGYRIYCNTSNGHLEAIDAASVVTQLAP